MFVPRDDRPSAPAGAAQTSGLRPGLRGRLLLLTLPAVNLVFIGIWWLATGTARDGLLRLSDQNLRMAAGSLADSLAQAMNDTRTDAVAAAGLDVAVQAIETRDPKNFAWFANALVGSKKRYTAMFITDRAGTIVAANTVGREGQKIPDLVGRDILGEPWGRQALDAEGDTIVHVPLGRPAFLRDLLAESEQLEGLSLPVADIVGDRMGTLTLFVSSHYLGRMLDGFLDVGDRLDAIAVITDRHGRPMVLPAGLTDRRVWEDPALSPIDAHADERHGAWTGPGGTRFLYAQAPIDGLDSGWRATAMRTVDTLEAPVSRMSGRLLGAFGGGILITSLVLVLIASRFVRPIRRLTEAAGRTGKATDFEPIAIETRDEIGVLTSAFNRMLADLKDNQLGLEAKVAERTAELALRNQHMRLVLDNVEQGLLTVTLTGELRPERSAVVDRWFGPVTGRQRFEDYIRPVDPDFADQFRLAYDGLVEDFLPREVSLAQMPTRVRLGNRDLECAYVPIVDGEALAGLLIVISDVSEQLMQALREAKRKELLAMFEAFARDRTGVLAFIEEVGALLATLASTSDLEVAKRVVHTLKGNTQMLGLGVVADLCQKMEDEMADSASLPSQVTHAALEAQWFDLVAQTWSLLGERRQSSVELSVGELEELASDLRQGLAPQAVLDRIASWQLEPTECALDRLGLAAKSLARRLGKGELSVIVDSGGVRLDPKRWAGMWADLVHAVRNAVDHGIESEAARRANGKSGPPELTLATRIEERTLFIEIGDNGMGIDWQSVRRLATARGVPAETQADLERALFSDGFTTREEVTATSGRGVGLCALRRRVEELGGSIQLHSEKGRGTRLVVRFPLEKVGPRFGVEVRSASGEAHPVAPVRPADARQA